MPITFTAVNFALQNPADGLMVSCRQIVHCLRPELSRPAKAVHCRILAAKHEPRFGVEDVLCCEPVDPCMMGPGMPKRLKPAHQGQPTSHEIQSLWHRCTTAARGVYRQGTRLQAGSHSRPKRAVGNQACPLQKLIRLVHIAGDKGAQAITLI